ncbi:MAG: MBL fold metallo-hydrolase [Deltaproteobacteria bacterium]|jgi:glyoxylase-like metal-dependent hydrolase (beta-lactamase superfamily II)|nr:MBL fold metallo-hydrolase [Deltaproteobacteria bacterium]MBT4262735.1 MBL fold metallo-hydrolase [Deltaproteobacteria bacterium]MBT4642274.1 MBL fold metallo-hydrolase [Deltaproteobacteria bacterium]MBT6502600.1 MBL fold metallo-hydrolase [Deltaproteobacteria bacterium]MBT6611910.1 MBL fold metallo-hydrolase [Deltaproteobacteria bacterium]
MRFGDYDCYALDLGDFMVDGGALFGTVPKIQWQEKMPADSNNRVPLKSRALLIQGNGKQILVDAGFGTVLSAETKAEYGIVDPVPNLNLILSGYDIDITQITDVVLTHLHFDHAGGSIMDSHGGPAPFFPNAVYHVQKEHWEEVMNPHEREKESFGAVDYSALQSYGVLNLLEGSLALVDGIEIMVSYGHTRAQQHVLVKDENRALFFCSDLVPTIAHIPVPWHMAYDNKPMELYPEKDFFLRKAFRGNWVLFFAHDPKIAAATVKEGQMWMELDQAVKL